MSFTVQDVIRVLHRPSGSQTSTVDGIIIGNSNQEVQGVAVSFTASYTAIQQAAQLGANLFITHEGPYYEHQGNRGKQSEADDPVIVRKRELIDSHRMVLYRYHDGPHQTNPDIITHGLLQALGWDTHDYKHSQTSCIITFPSPVCVQEIACHLKDRLNLPYVRFTGDSEHKCSKIALTVGYRGGGNLALPLFDTEEVDLLISGEGPEWETPEYIQDAVHQGISKSLIFIGHAASEEPGMKIVAQQIQDQFPSLPVYFIPSSPIISVL